MLSLAILFGAVASGIPTYAADGVTENNSGNLIKSPEIPLRLWYDEPASHGIDTDFETREGVGTLGSNSVIKNALCDWENWSIPIGNGYFGVNLFGRTESERIQITEKTLTNPYNSWNTSLGGLNNFSETYIDFGHPENEVSGYSRELDFATAVSTVSYTYGGVKYSREYFTSYPDKALVIKLTADSEGKLAFTLRPTVPYEQSWSLSTADNASKTGTVSSRVEGDKGVIELSGKLGNYDLDFLGIYNVYTDGVMSAATAEHKWTDSDGTPVVDIDGTIEVKDATVAYVYVTLGTDYEVCSENYGGSKPTYTTTLDDTRAKVEGYMSDLTAKIDTASLEESYQSVKATHIADHGGLFNRVAVNLNCDSADFALTTDELVESYRAGTNTSTYLEALLFQYGRYLLIASSRTGALPANLQGTWNKYNYTPWSGGFWHNINIQMNYWPAFSTNLKEVFEPYLDYAETYVPYLEGQADKLINTNNPSASGEDGGNGWTIGVGNHPFSMSAQWSPGHLGFTTVMFYDYYAFTKDEALLEQMFELLAGAARYITKTVVEDENGKLLVHNCESPEQYVDGQLYYTNGTTYTQSLIYENNYNLIRLSKELGVDISDIDASSLSADDKAILKKVISQTEKYDPIIVGYSGQVKEFREEDYYGDLGAAQYVHISQLVGLYPGTIINSSTPAWQDAAKKSLEGRGLTTEGWGYAHRTNAYARLGEGDMAHTMIHNQIRDSIGNNLWSHYYVFQVEGNMGMTAGISEMLLQSHEGFIAPLAALPAEWASGSYTGLVARGNFEVSAEWADGLARTFNITSNSGGIARVSYPTIGNATVVRFSDGKSISYVKESSGLISFDTEAGETYIISGFTATESLDAPETVGFTRQPLGKFNIVTSAVEGATEYKLYTAVESAPVYTLAESSVSPFFSYQPAEGEENARTTFRVTAVNGNGTESEGTICYFVPDDFTPTVNNLIGNVIDDKLQITVSNEGTASEFRLYTRADEAAVWTLASESSYPVIITEYDASLEYGVSAVSAYDGTESEIFKLTAFGTGVIPVYNPDNVFEGKSFIAGSLATSVTTGYGYSKLTDGSTHYQTGRFSTSSGDSSQVLDGTIDLGGGFHLYELQLRDFGENFCGNGLTVEVYSLGKWTKVVEWADHAEVLTHRVSGSVCVDMGGVRAEKVRVYIPSRYGTSTISFYEFTCTGVADRNTNPLIDNVFAQKEFVKGSLATSIHPGYDYTKLTDESRDYKTGRFSTLSGDSSQVLDGTVDLGGGFYLYDLKLSYAGEDFCGNGLTVEVYSLGKWTEIVEWADHAEMLEHKVSNYIYVDMGGVRAEKVRVYIPSRYGTSTISYYEFACSGREDIYSYTQINNVLSGSSFVPTSDANNVIHSTTFGYPTLTDGTYPTTHKGRFSTKSGATNQHVDGTIDLGGVYALDSFKIYEYGAGYCGSSVIVEVYYDGLWTVAGELTSEEDIAAHKASGVITLPLGGALAEKIRLYIPSKGSAVTISLWEVQCAAYKVDFAKKVDRSELLSELERLPFADLEDEINWKYIYNEYYNRFLAYASDLDATQAEVDAYVQEIRAYADTVNSTVLSAYNIALGGNIAMNFRFKVANSEELAKYADAYVEVTVPDVDGNNVYNIYFKDAEVDSEGRYIIPVKVCAAQMADKISLSVVYAEGILGETYTSSIKAYADRVLSDPKMEEAYPGVTELIKSMLNYGAYAQELFGYNTEDLANSGIYTDATDPVKNENITETSTLLVSGQVSGIKPSGWILSLLSETTARIYFTVEDGYSIDDYTFTLINENGEAKELSAKADGGRIRVDVSNIGANRLDKQQTIRVQRDGEVLTVTFSALCYVGAVLSNEASDDTLVNFARSLKLYSEAANNYLSRNS
ncbi:MAG: glycoside hydrolase N-terminal domain-containing protein [Clostridia bacterium]|nr:glycoside hydrolase N-terminal domain-containing protein [Clostridia bacterium]